MKSLLKRLSVVSGCALAFGVADLFAVEYQETTAGNKPEPPACLEFGDYDSLKTDLATYWEPSPSSNVWGYVAYYSTDGGLTWKDAGYCRADADGRTAKGVGKYGTWTYKVAAFNESGNSAWIQGSWNYGEYAKPGAIAFGAYDAEAKTLEYSWGESASDSLKCYPCEYSTDSGKTWKVAGNVKWNRSYRTATAVEPGTCFRVCAEDSDGFRTPWVVATFEGK